MSAIDQLLADQVEILTDENNSLRERGTRLSKLLAEALDILDKFQRNAKEQLEHYELERNDHGDFDPEKLRSR